MRDECGRVDDPLHAGVRVFAARCVSALPRPCFGSTHLGSPLALTPFPHIHPVQTRRSLMRTSPSLMSPPPARSEGRLTPPACCRLERRAAMPHRLPLSLSRSSSFILLPAIPLLPVLLLPLRRSSVLLKLCCCFATDVSHCSNDSIQEAG